MLGDQRRLLRAKCILYCGTVVLGVLLLPALQGLEENWGLDALFYWRGDVAPPNDVVVVAIDERSRSLVERPDARLLYARVVDSLSRAGASLIVLDLFLHKESTYDELLARSMRQVNNVMVTALVQREKRAGLDRQTLQMPAPMLEANALGMAPWLIPEVFRVNWVFERDQADRFTVPFVALQARVYDEFIALLKTVKPAETAELPSDRGKLTPGSLERIMEKLRALFEREPLLAARMLERVGSRQPALRSLLEMYANSGTLESNRLYINYYGAPRTIKTVSYRDVLDGRFPRTRRGLQGAVVFFGFSALEQPGQRDDYPYVYSRDGLNLSGVEMAATAFANLLYGRILRLPPFAVRAVLVALWGLLIATSFGVLRQASGVALGAALCAGYGWGALFLFRAESAWLPLVVPAMQFVFAGGWSLRVRQLQERVLLEAGTAEEAALALTGRGKPEKVDYRVVLHADEQGSKKWLRRAVTELDERQRLLLEAEFAQIRDNAIIDNGGRINHLLADSMLASWITRDPKTGDPSTHMNAACRAALSIRAGIDAFSRAHPRYPLQLRLGLHCGRIVSHLNPSPFIKDWRMEGLAIHAAERLESFNKVVGTWILVSSDVARCLDTREFWTPLLGTFVFCDEGGEVVVDPIAVHELRSASTISVEQQQRAARLEAALAAIERQHWESAIADLEWLAGQAQHVRLVTRYLYWCVESAEEIECGWRGVVKVTISDKSQLLDRYLA